MSQAELLQGLCPQCGETLDIPAHLKQFSCMYCGARLTPADLSTEPEPEPVCDIDGEACAAYYRDHVLETIVNYLGIEKEMTRSSYYESFTRYTSGCAEIFQQLNQAVSVGAITLDDAAAHFLDALQHRWEAGKSWKQSANSMMETDKFVIAIYLVPMIRSLKLSISEDYCTVLHEQWMARYPKSPFFLGTYEELSSGFNKKFLGLCFITTAICRHSGKADDCAELTAFRSFRDGYLRACPDGPDLIDKYYEIAPSIVLRLELSEDRDARYDAIRKTYLEPCFADIRAGRLRQCKDRYTDMVLTLEQEYLS